MTDCLMLFKAFLLVDKPAFRRLLLYMRPATRELDIPHRTKVREEVIVKADQYLNKLTHIFKACISISNSRFLN